MCEAALEYDTYPGSAVQPGPGRELTSSATSAAMVTAKPAFTLSLDTTSLGDTNGSTVVVGEIVEYVGVMTLPELTMASLISVTLANGLLVRSATVIGVGSSLGVNSLSVGGSGVSTGVSGGATRVEFDFGTVTNSFDDVANAEDRISVRVVAQVEDIGAVSNGVLLSTSGQAEADTLTL